MTIYSANAAKALLPYETLKKLGRPRSNYANPTAYRESKKTFCLTLAKEFSERMDADWCIAESGATDASALPPWLQDAGAFTAIAIVKNVGKMGVDQKASQPIEIVKLFDAPVGQTREENMDYFCNVGLELLGQVVKGESIESKL